MKVDISDTTRRHCKLMMTFLSVNFVDSLVRREIYAVYLPMMREKKETS